MGRYELRKTVGWKTAMITAPAQFLYALSSAHVNNNLPLIAASLGITTAIASWIINIELLTVVITATMTGKLADKFGTPIVFTIGTILFAICNIMFLIPQLETSFAGVLSLRLGASIGLGLVLPSSTPLAYILIQPNKLPTAIAIISIMVPVGMIFSASVAGVVAQASSWRYMFVITGCVAIIYVIAQVSTLPYKVPTRHAKIDFIGVIQLSIGLSLLILSLTGLSDQFIPYYASSILLVLSIGIIIFFFVYNKKWSKNPIFALEVFNKSTILVELLILLNNTISFCEKFYMPYVQMRLVNLTPAISGIVIAVAGCGSFVFSPIGNLMFKKLITKRSILIIYSVYIVVLLFNGLHVRYFLNIPLYGILNFIGMGLFVATTICLTNYNFSASPPKYANQIGVFNQIVTNTGHSIGVSIAVLVNNLFYGDNSGKGTLSAKSVFWVYMFSAFLGIGVVSITFFMGVFRFERGTKGFTERDVHKTSTFNENLMGDTEIIELDQFQQTSTQSEGKFIKLFSGMQF